MSLQASPLAPIPAETARVAHAAFPKGMLCLQIRDTLGPLYTDAQFAALFSPTGQPAEAPARLALVLILQFAEGLSDRQAAEAVRGRIDWKYALALELTDPGCDASVLSEFRTRLVHGGAEHLLLEPLWQQLEAHDLLQTRGTQRIDSTHILAAIRTLNRLELVGETMRYALNRLAVAAPAWLQAHLHPAWGDRYCPRVENYRLPKTEAERQQLAATIGPMGSRSFGPPMRPRRRQKSARRPRSRCSARSGCSNTTAPTTHPAGDRSPTCLPLPSSSMRPTIWTRAIVSSAAVPGSATKPI